MAAIYLIRHGQASFGKADYDQLSKKGINQSRLLGEYWRVLPAPDKFYSGDLLRHGQTLENFISGYNGEIKPLTIFAGFNEFNHVDILSRYNSKWHNFAEMSKSMANFPEPNKTFQIEFSHALTRWMSGSNDNEYKESWPNFKQRCIDSLMDVINQELAANNSLRAKNIFIFTSGGPIAVIIQHILKLADPMMLEINQQLRNTSVTKLLFSDDQLNIDYFNNYSHLAIAGADWVSYR